MNNPESRNPRMLTRRHALVGMLAGAGALASSRLIASDALPQLAEDDPQAKALGYHHDAAAVDVAAFPKKAGPDGAKQVCGTCALFTDNGTAWGACSIFPGKAVAKGGWCNVWAPKA